MEEKARHPKGKLRNKIFLMMALVSVIPVLIAGSLSVYSIVLSHRIDVANLESALLDQKSAEIQNLMSSIANSLQSRVISHGSVDFASVDIPATLKTIFTSNRSLGFQAASIVDLSGKELARIDDSAPDNVVTSGLGNYADAPWFAAAKAGKFYFSDDVNFVNNVPTLTVAAPFFDQNNVVRYVQYGIFNLHKVQEIMQGVELGQTGYLYLVDRKGAVMGSGVSGPAPASNVDGIGIIKDVIGGRDFIGSADQKRYANFYGETVVAAGKFVPITQSGIAIFNWGLVAEWPAKEADASINDLIYKNIVVSLLVFFIITLLSILFAGFIVRPIRALEKGTQLVATGKFDEEVRIRTGDELEELGGAFNAMVAGLKQLEELKNEFVFVAAHELRTPVAAMKGYLTLILEGLTGPIGDKTKDFIQKVVDSNQRLIQLVNDLLEVSRSEGGKLTIKVAPIDIVEPIKGVLTELAALAAEHQVQVIYEPFDSAQGKPLPKVLADADRLKEVIVNLVGNSIKYMGGSGKVTISHDTQNGNVITHIADTGLGISKEAQAKLFEKFYRVSTDKTQGITGTGLGLFIVKEIIQKMNGTISVESEEGKGAAFSFSLPIANG